MHCNLAKQMLYEFHCKQNFKKPGSVHATYLITGIKKAEPKSEGNHPIPKQDGEDTVMQSSPPLLGSSMPQQDDSEESSTPIRSIMLAREEHVEQARATFETVTGLHIYTLEVGLGDIQALTECNRKIAVDYASEDPLKDWKQYGTIQNPSARRRTRKTAAPPTPPVKDEKVKAKAVAPTSKGIAMQKPAERATDSTKATPEPEKDDSKPAAKKPANVKRESSSLFKSFAKAKDKPKRQESSNSATSASASPAPPAEDEPLQGMSEDEADDGAAGEEEEPTKAPEGKSKREREADLQAMMDQEDEDEPMEDAADSGALDKKADAEDDPQQKAEDADKENESVTVEGGRRRGRRRVMKKKTVKDDEGYLGK